MNQLFEFGAGKEIRTPDPNLGKVVLYQLSYSRLLHYLTLLPGVYQILDDIGIPKGIRTPVTAVKGRCPRPLDDGDIALSAAHSIALLLICKNFSYFLNDFLIKRLA